MGMPHFVGLLWTQILEFSRKTKSRRANKQEMILRDLLLVRLAHSS